MSQIESTIREIERDILKLNEDKEQAIERSDLSNALAIQWAIAGLNKAIGLLRKTEIIVSQETKENNGVN